MKLPYWCVEEILKYQAPVTGKVTIDLEIYNNGVTKMEIGGTVRIKPEGAQEVVHGKTPWVRNDGRDR